MKFSFARRLRFSYIGKILFNIKFVDKILRVLFLNKFTEDYYSDTTKNWSKINEDINKILNKYKGFLGHGAALSIIRDGKINYNQDLDYDIYPIKDEETFFKYVKKLGFKVIQKTYIDNILTMFILEKDNAYIDFFVINNEEDNSYIATTSYEHNKNYFTKEGQYYSTTKAIAYKRYIPKITAIELKEINDNSIYLPKNYDDYFISLYGYDWRVPKRYFNWKLEPKNNRVKIIKNNILMLVTKDNYVKITGDEIE